MSSFKMSEIATRPNMENTIDGDLNNIKLKLKKRRVSINNRELLLAAEEGNYREVERLLHLGADVNFTDRDGNTALHYGIYSEKSNIVDLLLNKVANICLENNENKTALNIAQQNNVQEVIKSVREKILDEALDVLEKYSTVQRTLSMDGKKESNFIEETFTGNYRVCLGIDDINEVLNFRYKREGANEMYEAVTFECLEGRLKPTLESRKTSTFIVRMDFTRWITLVFHYRGNKWSAYYTDSSAKPINGPMQRIINKIFNVNKQDGLTVLELYRENNEYDSWILAIKNAEIITSNINDVDKMQPLEIDLVAERELLANMLNEMQRTKKKITFCLKTLKELNRHKENCVKFTYKNANVFVMFLETFALEDTYPTTSETDSSKVHMLTKYLQKLKKEYFTEFYFKPKRNGPGKPDINLISHARTVILHNSKIIQPDDLAEFIVCNPENDSFIIHFFLELEKYTENVYNKLMKDNEIKENLQCNSFLVDFPKSANSVKECDTQEVFSKFVQKAYRPRIELEEELEEMIFDLTVNIIPVLVKENEKVHDFKSVRNNLVHRFQEFDDLDGRSKEFRDVIFSLRSKLFKYYYSKKIHQKFKAMWDHPGENIENEMKHLDNELKKFELDFETNFGLERVESVEGVRGSFEYKFAQSLFPEKEEDVKALVHLYFKFMIITDNVEEDYYNQDYQTCGEEPLIVSNNCREITVLEKREIFEDFIKLKRVSVDDKLYKDMKDDLRIKLKNKCNVVDEIFNEIVLVYIEQDKDLDYASQEKANQISNILAVLKRLKKNYSFSNKDLILLYNLVLEGENIFDVSKHQNIVKQYNLSEKEQLDILRLLDNIPAVKIIKIPVGKKFVVEINTFKIISNMLQVFYSSYNEYQIKFNNIEEAFNDSKFLDYLVSRDIEYNENETFRFKDNYYIYFVIKKIIKIKYAAPYIVALLVKVGNDKVIDRDDLILLIETLLSRNTFSTHLEQLLYIRSDKLNLYEEVCKNIFNNKNVNVDIIHFILTQPHHVGGILNEIIKPEANSMVDENNTQVLRKINQLLNAIANEYRNTGNFTEALKILDNFELIAVQKKFFESDDAIVLDTKYQIARAKILKGKIIKDSGAEKIFTEALQILEEIKDKIGLRDVPRYILYTTELHYALVLLKQYSQPPLELYEVMRRYSLGLPLMNIEMNKFNSKHIRSEHNEIITSKKYIQLLNYCSELHKQVDILFIINDIAYQKCFIAHSHLMDGNYELALNDYKESHEISSAVHSIRKELNDPTYLILSLRNLAFVNLQMGILSMKKNRVDKSKVNPENTLTLCNQMLNYYYEALMYNVEIYKRQKERISCMNHNLSICRSNVSKTLNNIAFAYREMGNLNKTDIEYIKSFHILKQVHSFIKATSHESDLKILKSEENVAKTCSILAFVYRDLGNNLKVDEYGNESLKCFSNLYHTIKKTSGRKEDLARINNETKKLLILLKK